MTRINSNLDPSLLTRVHLVAELREITMVPVALKRSQRTKSTEAIKRSIPKNFTLNAGHVTFFYDKMTFLHNRFKQLATEMEKRGFTPDWSRQEAFIGFDKTWCNDWKSTVVDDAVIIERINLRISQKPHLYKDI
jgi:deoxyribonuclease (pyrimidine dimer)